ncbi:polysaccharide biosynthesis protein [Alphaproteobacteria bacterium]|nr:polysaccharide biosynthesis protein [Alphaproteobacteria bacterium]
MTRNLSGPEDLYDIFNRTSSLTKQDVAANESQLKDIIQKSSFLVVGAAGTIGSAVSREIFSRHPKLLHICDINENNLVELVRDLRSSFGNGSSELKSFCVDLGSDIFDALIHNNEHYDYILNLSAMKHVRSERDAYTLMRMLETNVTNSLKLAKMSDKMKAKKYFCVSTDKAANPTSLMGASKLIMEREHFSDTLNVNVSMARFANVAFSDGSLLHGFKMRIEKKQPITAPYDIKRYFITQKEAGEICLLSSLLGSHRQIFFPKLFASSDLIDFRSIALRFLEKLGFVAMECSSEEEARDRAAHEDGRTWPCYFFKSDTTGEKPFEEFFTKNENTDVTRFNGLGVINSQKHFQSFDISTQLTNLRKSGSWNKAEIVQLIESYLVDYQHEDKGRFLDEKM